MISARPALTGGIAGSGQRGFWWHRARITAPLAPCWFSASVARLLASELNADGLLIVADAIAEAAHSADIEGQPTLAAQLRELAELPRTLASQRAHQEESACR
jgi:hypothetical protein